ncbi:hypothetical protein DFH09DRAFT_1092590 [Mycena vulgaris]|nr:hypothetical protein DFH09DRAFT_1092590 [Mycena vulgaris]
MSGGRGCFNCGGCALSLSSLPSPLFPLFFEIAFELFRETYSFYIPGTLLTTFISSFYNHSIPYTNAGVLSYRRGEYTLFPNALSSVYHENRIVNSAQSATKRLLAPRPERLHGILFWLLMCMAGVDGALTLAITTLNSCLGGLEGHVSRDCTAEAKPKSCYKCGQEGHISRDCPDSVASGGAFSSGGSGGGGGRSAGSECYKCGKVGHMARACPDAGAAPSSSYGGGGGGASAGGKTCYSCGGVGHLSRDCVQGSKCYNCAGVVSKFSLYLFLFLLLPRPGWRCGTGAMSPEARVPQRRASAVFWGPGPCPLSLPPPRLAFGWDADQKLRSPVRQRRGLLRIACMGATLGGCCIAFAFTPSYPLPLDSLANSVCRATSAATAPSRRNARATPAGARASSLRLSVWFEAGAFMPVRLHEQIPDVDGGVPILPVRPPGKAYSCTATHHAAARGRFLPRDGEGAGMPIGAGIRRMSSQRAMPARDFSSFLRPLEPPSLPLAHPLHPPTADHARHISRDCPGAAAV